MAWRQSAPEPAAATVVQTTSSADGRRRRPPRWRRCQRGIDTPVEWSTIAARTVLGYRADCGRLRFAERRGALDRAKRSVSLAPSRRHRFAGPRRVADAALALCCPFDACKLPGTRMADPDRA